MPLDTRIPLMAQGVQLPDQLDSLSKLANIQGMQAQNRLAGLKEKEYQRSVETQDRLAALSPKLMDPKTRNQAMTEIGDPEIMKQYADAFKAMDDETFNRMAKQNEIAGSLLFGVEQAPPEQRGIAYKQALAAYINATGEAPPDAPAEYDPNYVQSRLRVSIGVKGLVAQQNAERQASLTMRGQNMSSENARLSREMTEGHYRNQDALAQRKAEIDASRETAASLAERKQTIKEQQAAKKEEFKNKQTLEKASLVLGKVDEALGKVNPETKQREGGMVGASTTGFIGSTLGKIPGTGAYDLDKVLDTVRANIGFEELNAMRQASPTGGALGQVAVRELELLQATLGSLEQGQSGDKLRENLEAVATHYKNWKKAVDEAKNTAPDAGTDGGLTPDEQAEYDALKARFQK